MNLSALSPTMFNCQRLVIGVVPLTGLSGEVSSFD
jgi:hypothetical protein